MEQTLKFEEVPFTIGETGMIADVEASFEFSAVNGNLECLWMEIEVVGSETKAPLSIHTKEPTGKAIFDQIARALENDISVQVRMRELAA